MNLTADTRQQISWGFAILATTLFAVYSTIYSLTHGIYDVFPFLYFLPIIIFVYRYPHRGVFFSLFISIIYLGLIYYLSSFNASLIAVSTAWFVIFVTIGVVTSSFAESLKTEEKKYRGIFENSQAGIFTFNLTTQKIIEMNGKCAGMLKYGIQDLVNTDLATILPEPQEQDAFIQQIHIYSHIGNTELRIQTKDGAVRHFLVSASLTPNNIVICSLVDITERKLAEKVIQKAKDDLEQRVSERTGELLQANEILKAEIQERKRFEAAIQLANRKLNILSSITRHDILNQITAIIMYLTLTEELVTDPQGKEYLSKIEQITHLIQKQIKFTRDYQNIGANAPLWQNVSEVVDKAVKDLISSNIRIENNLGTVEIYADFLLEKVFYNLIDNTIRHGDHVTFIRFGYKREEDSLIILYEDDGKGVPADAKERVFKREYYRNTGYGLFLSQEILSMTGATIKETGEQGIGARFEIRIPKGMFRFPDEGFQR